MKHIQYKNSLSHPVLRLPVSTACLIGLIAAVSIYREGLNLQGVCLVSMFCLKVSWLCLIVSFTLIYKGDEMRPTDGTTNETINETKNQKHESE